MAIAVVIPKMGMTMESGTLVEWLVPDGASVQPGDPLFHMVTEKLDCDVEAEAAGRLAHAVDPDTELAPGGVVGWLLEPGELTPSPQSRPQRPPPERPQRDQQAQPSPAAAAQAAGARLAVSPNARRVASMLGVDLSAVQGTGPGGRITSEDVEAHAARLSATHAAPPVAELTPPAIGPSASPIARKLAERLGIDLLGVTGSGPGGLISRQDVEAMVRARATGSLSQTMPDNLSDRAAATAVPPSGPRAGERIRMVGMRGTIARRMHESLQTMAQLTLGMDITCDRLVALRQQLRDDWADDDERATPTYTDFVVKAAASALQTHPRLNARVTDDAVELLPEIHVGLAVALEQGLVVVTIRNTNELSLAEVAMETARMSAAARQGQLALDDMAGSTFSVTTLGAYGIDMFTPVVNPPNVGVLGVGRLRDDVAWDGDTPRRVTRMTLSLTFDHRATDGVPAAEFLGAVRDLLERPSRLLS